MAKKKAAGRETSIKSSPQGARPGFKRATYYLTQDLLIRLKVHAAKNQKDLSTVVRDALDAHLPVVR